MHQFNVDYSDLGVVFCSNVASNEAYVWGLIFVLLLAQWLILGEVNIIAIIEIHPVHRPGRASHTQVVNIVN